MSRRFQLFQESRRQRANRAIGDVHRGQARVGQDSCHHFICAPARPVDRLRQAVTLRRPLHGFFEMTSGDRRTLAVA